MKLDELQARVVLLAQAVETSGLLDDAEVARVDDQAAGQASQTRLDEAGMAAVLVRRAQTIVDAARKQHASVIGLLDRSSSLSLSYGWLLIPMALGALADRVANPHRVDLLAAPFLLILLWNLVVYALLTLSLVRRKKPASASGLHALGLWLAGWRPLQRLGTAPTASVSAAFVRLWQPATEVLTLQRLTKWMHLAAAGWALGIVLSLLGRGLFVAYGVGWESTWLDAGVVNVLLRGLFAPLTALFSLEPFTLADIARLQVVNGAQGAGSELADGRRWLMLYAGLLMLVVIVPRLVLAAMAGLRARRLAGRIPVDLETPYFQRIIDNLFSAQVRLGIITHRAGDAAALAAVLEQVPAPALPGANGDRCLIDTPRGDALWSQDLPSRLQPGAPAAGVDLVLHVVSQPQDLAATLPQLQAIARPVLLLVRATDETAAGAAQLLELCRQHRRNHELTIEVLGFDDFALCWLLEPRLLEAMARNLPRARSRGFARLQDAWQQRNQGRFSDAMRLVGDTLKQIAEASESVNRLSLVDRLNPSKVREHRASRQQAMEAVQKRATGRLAQLLDELLDLHGHDASAVSELVFHADKPTFGVSGSMGAGDAAMGGAASGAAAGASIDLITGGMTLGAAAALGALAGGSAAFVGALWNNRDTPDGRLRIALSEEMLVALVQACLLHYLAVIHLRRGSGDLGRAGQLEIWTGEVAQEVRRRRKPLLAQLTSQASDADAVVALAAALRQTTADVLMRLYPAAGLQPMPVDAPAIQP